MARSGVLTVHLSKRFLPIAGVLILSISSLIGAAEIKWISTAGDSLIGEVSGLHYSVESDGRESRLLCTGCERGKEGEYNVRLSVLLPDSTPPRYRVTPLSSRTMEPQGSWRDPLPEDGAVAQHAVNRAGEGKPFLTRGEWEAILIVRVAPSPRGKQPVRVIEKFRIAVPRGAPVREFTSLRRRATTSAAPIEPTSLGRRTLASSLTSQPEWLIEVVIGDEDHSRFAEDGVYHLTYETVRAALASAGREGLAVGLPVSQMAMFSGAPDTLSQLAIGQPYGGTLEEVPIELADYGGDRGGGDGVFGPGDTLRFFAQGASRWAPAGTDTTGRPIWRFSQSPWSLERSYYLAVLGSGKGLRLDSRTWEGSPISLSSSHHYVRGEKDLLLRWIDENGRQDDSSGVEWYWLGTSPNGTTRFREADLDHPSLRSLDGIGSAGEAWVVLSFQPYSFRSTAFTTDSSGKQIDHSLRIDGVSLQKIGWRNGSDAWYRGTGFSSKQIGWDLTIRSVSDDYARLDGITMRWERSWKRDSGGVRILHDRPPGLYRRAVAGASGCRVLKVERGIASVVLPLRSGSFVDSASSADISYWIDCPADRRFIAKAIPLTPPVSRETVADLTRGVNLNGQKLSPEMVVITPKKWETIADEYVRFRSDESVAPATAAIVRTEDIYRLYSAGQKSPVAIRDYLRRARELWPQLRAVMLWGDGSYDYRGLDSRSEGGNELPLFQYQNTATDDYYGALDEGEWVIRQPYGLDLAVGRIPARSHSDLQRWLQKQRAYEGKRDYDPSEWRNRHLFTADDFLAGGGKLDRLPHTEQIEALAREADALFPIAENQRLFMAHYRLDGLGQKGEATTDWIEAVNHGRWMTIYFGHGGAHQMADENLFDLARISQLRNRSRPGIFAFFSCLLGRFDRPSQLSLAEALLFAEGGGGVGMIAPIRESYPTPNEALAQRVLEELAGTEKSLRMGEVLLRAKNGVFNGTFERDNTQKYMWLGDPFTPRLGWKARIRWEQFPDTLQALQKVKLSGLVEGLSSGEIFLQVEEQSNLRSFVDTLNTLDAGRVEKIWKVQEPGRVLFGTRQTVADGRFQTEFISPRKLSFGDTNGVVRAYVWSPREGIRGGGVSSGISIWGTDPGADSLRDHTPPEIRAWLCDSPPAQHGYLGSRATLTLPTCLSIEVTDSTGVDQSTLPDEGVTWEWIGLSSPRHPPFSEQTGQRVVFQLQVDEFRPSGKQSLRIRAQDILGNTAEKEWELNWDTETQGGLFDLVSVPNPMKDQTTFRFKWSGSSPANVTIRIYNINGKLVKVLPRAVSGITVWNGRDAWNNRLANGLYYYRAEAVTRTTDSATGKNTTRRFSRLQKLVISR